MKLKSKEYGEQQLLNPEFKYVPASRTDIRETFKRIRREQEREAAEKKNTNVAPLRKVQS